MRKYWPACSKIFDGTCNRRNIGSTVIRPQIVTTEERITPPIIAAPRTRWNSFWHFAPACTEAIIQMAFEASLHMAIINQVIQLVHPMAAKASTPRKFPTMAASVAVYNCAARFPTIRGAEKNKILLIGLPCSMSTSRTSAFSRIGPSLSTQVPQHVTGCNTC